MLRPSKILLLATLLVVAGGEASAATEAGATRPFSAPWQEDLLESPAPVRLDPAPGRALAALSTALAQEDAAEVGASAPAAPRRWWPLLASAALPGLGESLTGHRRGWFMIAADVGIWYGVIDRSNEGDDWETRYEAFALEHWSEDAWTRAVATSANFREYYPDEGFVPEDVALYVSREDDEREWFENLGKWDVFAWGWREFWDDAWNEERHEDFLGAELYQPDPDDRSTWFFPNDKATMTPLRDEYLEMRVKSNDAYQTRDQLFNAAVLLRVFSVLQTAYLEGFIGGRYDAADVGAAAPREDLDRPRAAWVLAPFEGDGALVGWKVEY